MKRSAILAATITLLLVPTVLVAQEPRDLEELVRRGELYLHPDSYEPFSGPVVSYWTYGMDEQLGGVKERGTLRNGVWEGEHEWYHITGELATRETYRNGELNGPSESYFKTGRISAREHYGNGQLDGPYESYWHRGRLAERGEWSAGQPCGNWLSFGRTDHLPGLPGLLGETR